MFEYLYKRMKVTAWVKQLFFRLEFVYFFVPLLPAFLIISACGNGLKHVEVKQVIHADDHMQCRAVAISIYEELIGSNLLSGKFINTVFIDTEQCVQKYLTPLVAARQQGASVSVKLLYETIRELPEKTAMVSQQGVRDDSSANKQMFEVLTYTMIQSGCLFGTARTIVFDESDGYEVVRRKEAYEIPLASP